METVNYYELLNLEPDASLSQINDAIKDNQLRWQKAGGNRRDQGRSNLKKLPEIKKVMLDKDSSLRLQMQDELRNKKKLLWERVVDDLLTMSSNGYILRGDLELLIKEHRDSAMTVGQLEIIAVAKKIEIRDEAPDGPGQSPVLDDAVEQRIAQNLAVVGKKDLYDFLGLERSAGLPILKEQARERLNAARDNIKKDAGVNAEQGLGGECLRLFADQSLRDSYDETLRRQAIKPILDLARMYAGAEGDINPLEYYKILAAGRREGNSRDLVVYRIQEEAKKAENNWRVDIQTICECGEINPSFLIYCKREQCAAQLHDIRPVICPSCKKESHPLGDYCTGCGIGREMVFDK